MEISSDGILGVLGAFDLVWLIAFLVAIMGIAIWTNLKVGTADAEAYFLGGRNAQWWVIGLSLFASNLGTDHLVGLAGSGAAGGLAVASYEILASPILLALGFVFAPHYLSYKIYTTPEYLEKRFGENLRMFFTWLSILATIFTKISVTVFAGAVVLEEVLGWNRFVGSVALLALTTVYTAMGGLAAVLYTDALCAVFLIVGSIALLGFGISEVGGLSALPDKLPESYFRLIKPLDDPDFPWLGIFIGMPINSIWYWCTDQVMVQRVLAAKDIGECQAGCVLAAWLKQLPNYVMVLPGLVAAALFPKAISEDSNRAYALMVARLLPKGWVGIMSAVMLASFMAALSSCFNSASTLFTMDVYAKLCPGQSESRLVFVGRAFTVLCAIISIGWLPVIENANEQLFLYIQSVQCVWCSPIAMVFLAAVYMPTLSSFTVWVTLIFGIGIGLVFFFMQRFEVGGWIAEFNILHFAVVDFVLCGILMAVTHTLEKHNAEEIQPLLSQKRAVEDDDVSKEESSGIITKLMSVGVLGVVVFVYILHDVIWPRYPQ
mmetsp:Transcript_98737/g.171061  ORF Transcript_98737/g.171061 Transcript_98737/m.171061 type:complete len:547 (-) Transcript_98737:105-1745(-)